MSVPLHLAVALNGAGWHPAAWREPSARPAELFSAGYWLDLASEAERGLLDFLTIEDSFVLQTSNGQPETEGAGLVAGRLDAVLIASRIAPLTHHIGLVPTALATHTEPFHISKAIATLDHVSTGRAGVRVQLSPGAREAKLFGRRSFPEPGHDNGSATREVVSELFDEGADFVEVMRRLWDSWEDGAEIRDASTGRFIDRAKIHYIDFQGARFTVKGPSIVPRPPQGQPLVTALARTTVAYRFAARSSDVVLVTPTDAADAARIVREVRAEQLAAGRADAHVHIFADIVVFLDDRSGTGAGRKERLDEVAGTEYASDAAVFAGSASDLADLLQGWQASGISGYRLRPAALPDDLVSISADLVPELHARGLFRRDYESASLRGLLGLDRPQNRYSDGRGTVDAATHASQQGVPA